MLRLGKSLVVEPETMMKSTLPSVPTILSPSDADGICDEKSNEAVDSAPVALPELANTLVEVALVNAPGVTLVTKRDLPPSAKYFCALIDVKNSYWVLPERNVDPNFSR